MKLTDVIRRPLITEKTSILREDGRTLVFHVAREANKAEIKRAVEELFEVKVLAVRTMVRNGKLKGRARLKRRMPDWKRAIVTLKAGDSVEFL